MEHYNEMLTVARDFGLDVNHLEASSNWQRVKTLNKPKRKNGSYYIFSGAKAMILWDWQHNISKTWRAKGYSFTRQDKVELNLARAADKAKRAQNQRKAICRCKSIWRQSTSANNHPYIIRKKIKPYISRVDGFDNLIVPVCSLDGELMSIQFISTNGQKRFKSGACLKGNGALIGDFNNPSVLLICEGYATGCSLHEATGQPVIVAFNAGNLSIVSKALSLKHPKTKLIICSDNDHQTEVKTGYNTGLEKAKEVAKQFNLKIVWPDFDSKNSGSDFNDIHCQFGLEGLKTMLSSIFYERIE